MIPGINKITVMEFINFQKDEWTNFNHFITLSGFIARFHYGGSGSTG